MHDVVIIGVAVLRISRLLNTLPAEYSPVLALWLVRLSACRSPGYGGQVGSHACASYPASTSRKKTRAVPGEAGQQPAHRHPIPRALTTPPAGTLQAEHRCSGNWTLWLCRRLGGYRRPGTASAISRRSPGGHLGAGCQGWSARWSCVGAQARTGRPGSSSSPAIRRPAGPGPPPAAPVTGTSPLTRALLGVPRRLARQDYNQ